MYNQYLKQVSFSFDTYEQNDHIVMAVYKNKMYVCAYSCHKWTSCWTYISEV